MAGSVVLSILSPCMFVLQPSLANLLGCLGQVLQAAVGVWLAWNDGDAGEVERRRRGKKKVD